jgi:iron(III) transport system substrate-binding protein
MRSSAPADKAVMERIGVVFPDQAGHGTHLNIAGGAVARHARNIDAARQFLEYLSGDDAQRYFADGNNEWPVVEGVKADNPALKAFGNFKGEQIPISRVGMNQVKVQQMLDRIGYR